MALVSIPNTFTVGQTIVASAHNQNFSVIYSDYDGNIDNTNISASAAIADTKLAQITTASKVSGASLTLLTSIVSGAGLIPVANIDTGTTANKIVILNGSAQLPAVSGALLTNLTATLGSILDYGTSLTAGTSKAQNTLRIVYGQATLTTGLAQITNLPFTSSTSYQVTLTRVLNTDITQEVQIKSYDSGSAFTIRDSLNGSSVVSWIAVGT